MATLAHIAKQLESVQAIVQSAERTRRFMKDFSRQNRLLAGFYGDALRHELARRGWFIAGTLYPGQYTPLAEALAHNWEHEIEAFLTAHVRRLVPGVRSNTTQRWPNRAGILYDAFEAHSAQHYTLSIPVFLAQADGISADLLVAFLFTNRRGRISKAASRVIDDGFSQRPLAKSFLGLLLEESGLRLDTDERDNLAASGQVVSPLNRHGVLHGLDCNYATETNSLRCIALIGFLGWVTEVLQNQSERTFQQTDRGDQ